MNELNDLEKTLAKLSPAQRELFLPEPHDDFFALGGESLLGTQLLTHLQDTYPVKPPLQQLA